MAKQDGRRDDAVSAFILDRASCAAMTRWPGPGQRGPGESVRPRGLGRRQRRSPSRAGPGEPVSVPSPALAEFYRGGGSGEAIDLDWAEAAPVLLLPESASRTSQAICWQPSMPAVRSAIDALAVATAARLAGGLIVTHDPPTSKARQQITPMSAASLCDATPAGPRTSQKGHVGWTLIYSAPVSPFAGTATRAKGTPKGCVC
jgi:hypothetical protein